MLSFLDRRDRDAGWGVDTGSRSGPFFHPAFIPAFVLGAICIVAGSFGAFFARIFKSAASRQRECLADAAALCLLDLEQCNLPQMDEAITKTAQAARPLKQQILNGLICAAAADGLLKRREAELLRAIADAFAAPLPPFLCAEPERTQEVRAVE